jgi:hypothetical protein
MVCAAALWAMPARADDSGVAVRIDKVFVSIGPAVVARIVRADSDAAICRLEFHAGVDVLTFEWAGPKDDVVMALHRPSWMFDTDGVMVRMRVYVNGAQIFHDETGALIPIATADARGPFITFRLAFDVITMISRAGEIGFEFVDEIDAPMRFSTRGKAILLPAVERCQQSLAPAADAPGG